MEQMEMLVSSLVEKVLLWNATFLFISCLDNGQVSSVYLIFLQIFKQALRKMEENGNGNTENIAVDIGLVYW